MNLANFKDYLGQEVKVGDMVIVAAPRYRMFTKGIVQSISPKECKVEINNTWNYGSGGLKEIVKYTHNFVIKVPET